MNISRRSFLKMAGLTTVAAAGAAMFTGCSLYTTVKMEIASADGSVATNVLTKINKEAPEITIPSFVKEINGVLKNTVNDALQKAFKEANYTQKVTINSIKVADGKMTIDVTADPKITEEEGKE
ncbi:twin-arginine translocation signal domain-containing protein [Faecalibacterium sp. AF10-46]|uniref:twin-arginine translocation signal domain-containing protein n=1 Tax=Faecalibacterium sp. AF10-46 TaxID=2302955 RepID=UPI000E769AE6|nr:twin-arginine translocation signal domain-containing protein [Faecalibacterium sp. AF10-46]RJW78101.1 twin-arginine translocation signal domain-containing protein [Faecalibacterium sp. AF10-46]